MAEGCIGLVGGLDPTGGAGLLRDGWTASARAPALRQRAVVTALTRQGRGAPASYRSVDARRLAAALAELAAEPELRAVKIGMIPDERVDVLTDFLLALRSREQPPAVVVDPVLRASDGGLLGAAPQRLGELVAHRVDLLTPNRDEASTLAEALRRSDGSIARPEELAARLGLAVLLKGEQSDDNRIRDRLCFPDGHEQRCERPRLSGPDPRGTGCALATAIACELARGCSLVTAVVAAVAWLDGARRRLHRGMDGRWRLPTELS